MIALGLATVAGVGTFLLFTALVDGRRGFGTSGDRRRAAPDIEAWLHQAGLDDVDPREFAAVELMLFGLACAGGYTIFGAVAPALAIGAFGASFPLAAYRHRRHGRRAGAQEAWPRMIEEIRVQTASLGRSIPHALFDVGARGPAELRPSFDAAHREWLLTTDLARTLAVLKKSLSDPTADMICETLLIAYELGGSDLDRRLEALADDRRQDVQGRKDAHSRQAGARFARVFVLVVPAGMALAGTSIGNGRAAYRTSGGQLLVLVAVLLVAICWTWAGRVMRLPETDRVFRG